MIRCAKNWKNTWMGASRARRFLDSLEVTITQLRKLPSERRDKVKGVKIRKDVLSRYRILLTTTADADRRV
jgi:hypothetical protein